MRSHRQFVRNYAWSLTLGGVFCAVVAALLGLDSTAVCASFVAALCLLWWCSVMFPVKAGPYAQCLWCDQYAPVAKPGVLAEHSCNDNVAPGRATAGTTLTDPVDILAVLTMQAQQQDAEERFVREALRLLCATITSLLGEPYLFTEADLRRIEQVVRSQQPGDLLRDGRKIYWQPNRYRAPRTLLVDADHKD